MDLLVTTTTTTTITMNIMDEHAYGQIDALASEVQEDVIRWRRHIHQYPELSNREANTSKFIEERLRSFGMDDVQTGIAGYGIVATLQGEQEGASVALLRADMDALPVKEVSEEPFKSTVVDQEYPGGPFPVSHACGHECHAAALLGAAYVLAKMRKHVKGRILFVFQPAEEGPPVTEEGGARVMLQHPLFHGTALAAPTMAFGLHVGPLPKGVVGYRTGVQFAASCLIKVEIKGAQVHASTPWQGVDPMPACGAILQGVSQLYRMFDASHALTISFGHVEDCGRFNIIGEKVTMWGTIRTTAGGDEMLKEVQEKLRAFVQATAQSYGCSANVDFLQNVPALRNEPQWMRAGVQTMQRTLGSAERVREVGAHMAYDDVAEFVNKFGGMYVMLGAQDVDMDSATGKMTPSKGGRGMVPNHNPRFYADDAVLIDAVRLHANVALDHLHGILVPSNRVNSGSS